MEMLSLAGANDHHHAPIACSFSNELVLFAGVQYRPTAWLMLKRDRVMSSDGYYVRSILKKCSITFLKTLMERFCQYGSRARPFDTKQDLLDRAMRALKGGRIQYFSLHPENWPRLHNPEDPLLGYPPFEAANEVAEIRDQLAKEFGATIAARWSSKDIHDHFFWSHGGIARELILTGADVHGIALATESVWDGIVSLAKMGVTVIEFAGDAMVFQLKTVGNLATGDFEAVARDLQKMGIEVEGTYKEVKALIDKGLEMLNFLQDDPVTKELLLDYFDSLWQSISYVERRVVTTKLIGEISIEVLIALATAGAGAAISATNASRRIGQFSAKMIDLLADLYKALYKKRRRQMIIESEANLPPPKTPKSIGVDTQQKATPTGDRKRRKSTTAQDAKKYWS